MPGPGNVHKHGVVAGPPKRPDPVKSPVVSAAAKSSKHPTQKHPRPANPLVIAGAKRTIRGVASYVRPGAVGQRGKPKVTTTKSGITVVQTRKARTTKHVTGKGPTRAQVVTARKSGPPKQLAAAPITRKPPTSQVTPGDQGGGGTPISNGGTDGPQNVGGGGGFPLIEIAAGLALLLVLLYYLRHAKHKGKRGRK